MKRKFKVFATSLLGLGSVAGFVTAVVACGSTEPPPKGIYYSTISPGSFLKTKSDRELFVFIPWKFNTTYAKSATEFLKEGFATDESGYIPSGDLQGYRLVFKYTDNENKKGSNSIADSNVAVVSKILNGGDEKSLPDIVIAYPDVAAVFAAVGLLHDFGPGAKEKVVEGFASDVDSIPLHDGSRPNFLLPFAKSSDGTGVDIVVMAKILADAAGLRGTQDRLVVKADSDIDRMARMILADSSVKKVDGSGQVESVKIDLKMNGIYEPNAEADASGDASYNWSDFKKKWIEKTSPGGIWEFDKPVVEANFYFRNTDEAGQALLSVDFAKPIFENYKDLGDLVGKISLAYRLNKKADPFDSTFVLGYDSPVNAIYSYQYDLAGHTPESFFMSARPVIVGGKEKTGVIRYSLYDGAEEKSFVEAANWLSDLVKTGGVYIKGENSSNYSSILLQRHKLLLSIGSTNGFNLYIRFEDKRTKPYLSANLNVGELYFTLQPTKVSSSETKRSIINQGPSLFVVDIHGKEVGKKVGDQLLKAYGSGAKISGKKDLGYWGSSGYIYGNKESYEESSGFYDYLVKWTKTPSGWSYSIGKRLLLEYLQKVAQKPEKFDFYTNPVDEHTGEVRSNINTVYTSRFVNFFQDNALGMPSGDEVAQRVIALGLSNGWLKKADVPQQTHKSNEVFCNP